MSKTFDIDTNRTYGHIAAAATPTKSRQGMPAGAAEVAQRTAEMRTQGREGCKLPRMTMAFSPKNYDFIRVMAAMSGTNMTSFVNTVLDQYREEHGELYERARELRDSL